MNILINIASGNKTSSKEGVVNIDRSPLYRIKSSRMLKTFAEVLLNPERLLKLKGLPENIMYANVSKSLPFSGSSVDYAYNSHYLEHVDRRDVVPFLRNIKNVLKPKGILRIVVPDMEEVFGVYKKHVLECSTNKAEYAKHDKYVSDIFLQFVRTEAHGTSVQKPLRRFIENILLGSSMNRGENHKWMYDKYNLMAILEESGFIDIRTLSFRESGIPDWKAYGLDTNSDGSEYKPGSLYLECTKP